MARKNLSQKTPYGKKHRKSGAGQAQLTSPTRTLNKLLRTAIDKSRTSNIENHYTCTVENILKLVYTWTESDLDRAKR